MRFVTLKSNEPLDMQAIHRIRDQLIGQRTAVINQIRAFLLEYGLPVMDGIHCLAFQSRAASVFRQLNVAVELSPAMPTDRVPC